MNSSLTQLRHRWPHKDEEIVISAYEASDGNEHHIRQCFCCGITKITIIPPIATEAYHVWVTASGREWVGEATPPCSSVGLVETMSAPAEVPFT
jgi:hypothetical protein